MSGRGLLWRMGLLVAVFLAALAYILIDVIGVGPGVQPFTVTVDMAKAGGLFPGSYVTYRGVDVGRVQTLTLRRGDVVATATIDGGTRIPVGVTATVRDLSAIGEQYLDLVPGDPPGGHATTTEAVLRAGSVIRPSSVRTPVSIGQLLEDLGNLVSGISSTDVNEIATALGTGFAGTGQDLRNITVTGQQLVAALEAAEPATVTLIDDADPLLQTVLSSDSDLSTFATGIDQVTAQLQASDGDIRALLSNGVTAESQLTPFLQTNTPAVTQLLLDGAPLANVTAASQPAVQAFLQILPVFAGDVSGAVHGNALNVELRYNTDEPVCPYISGSQTPEPTQAVSAPVLDRQCTSTATGLLERGANDAPQP